MFAKDDLNLGRMSLAKHEIKLVEGAEFSMYHADMAATNFLLAEF